MSAITIALEGLIETKERYHALANASNATRALAGAIYKRESVVLALAQFLCPVRYGTLRRSGLAHLPEIAGETVTGEVSFGNSAVDYAWIVHENLQAFHKNGQAKYLETAALAEKEGTIEELVHATNDLMSSRGQIPRRLGTVR
jgi:hypothetical protein